MTTRGFRDRVRVSQRFIQPSLTKQSMADACDINRIMRRYLVSGTIDHLARHGGQYGFATSQTFHDAMNIVAVAEQMFADLSSDLRTRFSNDPAKFLDFVQDHRNVDEMRRLGLAKPAVAPAPDPVRRRVGELETDAAARLEIARKAIVAPPAP